MSVILEGTYKMYTLGEAAVQNSVEIRNGEGISFFIPGEELIMGVRTVLGLPPDAADDFLDLPAVEPDEDGEYVVPSTYLSDGNPDQALEVARFAYAVFLNGSSPAVKSRRAKVARLTEILRDELPDYMVTLAVDGLIAAGVEVPE